MILQRAGLSFSTRILLAVVVCAVLPLCAVGAWLTIAVANAGEVLLSSQLDSAAAHAADVAQRRWELRRADVTLLATNAPVVAALRGDSAQGAVASSYLTRAFQAMPGVVGAVVRDRHMRERWTVGEAMRVHSDAGAGIPFLPELTLRMPIVDPTTGAKLGVVEGRIRLESLLSSAPNADPTGGFVAVHADSGDAWLLPDTLPATMLASSRYEWAGHHWLASRRVLPPQGLTIIASAPVDGFLNALARTTRTGAVALALVAMIVVVLTLMVTGRLTRSLTRLAAAADDVSEGNLDTHIQVATLDEVGRVAQTFNAMTASLRAMLREKSQREAVSAMGELAATLAHQVRSPATAMRLDLERAQQRLSEGSTTRELVDRSLIQLARLERTVAGSLRVARTAAVKFEVIDLRVTLRRALAGAAVESSARGVQLLADGLDGPPIETLGDDGSLEQLFANVIANAVDAARIGGTVRVRCTSDAGAISVMIEDDGCGMNAEQLSRVGEPFFSTKPEGTGLGVTIARRIASAHGGTLQLESEAGTGTRATLLLRSA